MTVPACEWSSREDLSWISSLRTSSLTAEREPLPPHQSHPHHPTLSCRLQPLSLAVTTAAEPSPAWGSSAEGEHIFGSPGSLSSTRSSSSNENSTFCCSTGSEVSVSRWEVVSEHYIWKQDVMTLLLNNRISAVKIRFPLRFTLVQTDTLEIGKFRWKDKTQWCDLSQRVRGLIKWIINTAAIPGYAKFNSPHILVVFWAVTKGLKQQEFDLQFKQLDDYAEINRNYEVRKPLIR